MTTIEAFELDVIRHLIPHVDQPGVNALRDGLSVVDNVVEKYFRKNLPNADWLAVRDRGDHIKNRFEAAGRLFVPSYAGI